MFKEGISGKVIKLINIHDCGFNDYFRRKAKTPVGSFPGNKSVFNRFKAS